jgi:hypothetical protein
MWAAEIRRISVPGWPGQIVRPYLKNNRAKGTAGMVKAVELLPSKHEALSSNSSTEKQQKTDFKKNQTQM